jgi:phosphate transport system substrate-binding protein
MTAAEQAAAKGGEITQVPVALGGEGVVYNLSLPAGSRLHLTGPVLAAIFLGKVTRWTDPAITALNPGLSLPPAPINVVHRSDGSGTTYIFSNYLSSVDPAWAAKVGTGKTLRWPAGEGAEGNGGVAAAVNRTSFSIGYVEQAYSQGLLLPFAAIRNPAGRYVIPSTQTVAAGAAQKPGITPADFSIANQPGAASYPISGYSWALVYTRQHNQATGHALVIMLDWLTHDGQASAAANGYVPLPAQIRLLARTMLQQITGPTGIHLLSWRDGHNYGSRTESRRRRRGKSLWISASSTAENSHGPGVMMTVRVEGAPGSAGRTESASAAHLSLRRCRLLGAPVADHEALARRWHAF